jgi:putative transposase
MVDLCREFGISRKTGYKFLERFKKHGLVGLCDQSKRPIHLSRLTSAPIEQSILDLRGEFPTWGALKIREKLKSRNPGVRVPARSTIHEILNRNGLIKHRKRPRHKAQPTGLSDSQVPNHLWCADYKGQFRLGNSAYCYPLTITDYASRFLIACDGLEDNRTEGAMEAFECAFSEYGLPDAIRTDNGAPFATRGLHSLSRLSIWFLKLGIRLERIKPGKPQQNGRHERMHRTLKQETTRPAASNFLQQQERFDQFGHTYNNERPHEALNMATPASKYRASERKLPKVIPEPEYPSHDVKCYVNRSGMVYLPGHGSFGLSAILAGETVGIQEVDDSLWQVDFTDLTLGFYDEKEEIFQATEPINKG